MYSSQLSNFQILAIIMPFENITDLAKSLSDLKEELRFGFSSLKRELVDENNLAIKKLKSAASSAPKFKNKGNEKQFEVNSQVLDHVHSASSFLATTPPQVDKALEELKEGEKKLAHKNKLIRIADSAEEGWEVVNNYNVGHTRGASLGLQGNLSTSFLHFGTHAILNMGYLSTHVLFLHIHVFGRRHSAIVYF